MSETTSEVPAAPANSLKSKGMTGVQMVIVSLLMLNLYVFGKWVYLMEERRMYLYQRFVPVESDYGVCDTHVLLQSMPLDQTTCGQVLMKLLQLNNWV
jgi:hypothetical protein